MKTLKNDIRKTFFIINRHFTTQGGTCVEPHVVVHSQKHTLILIYVAKRGTQ